MQTFHSGPPANFTSYSAVVAPGRHDAWALGGTNSTASGSKPVAEHWTGSAWHLATVPSGFSGAIRAASASSSTDIWAISQSNPDGTSGGDILHWNGARWSVARHLAGSGQLTGVTALGPQNVWVFGGGGFIGGLGTWHFDCSSWTHWTGTANGLEEASALSPSSLWAIGGKTSPNDAIEHFDGTKWTYVTSRALSRLQSPASWPTLRPASG